MICLSFIYVYSPCQIRVCICIALSVPVEVCVVLRLTGTCVYCVPVSGIKKRCVCVSVKMATQRPGPPSSSREATNVSQLCWRPDGNSLIVLSYSSLSLSSIASVLVLVYGQGIHAGKCLFTGTGYPSTRGSRRETQALSISCFLVADWSARWLASTRLFAR